MSEYQNKIARHVFLFAGGGTGGHLYPAIALAERIKLEEPEAEIHFAGTKKGIEFRLIPQFGYPLHLVSIKGVRRRLTLQNAAVPFYLMWSFIQSAALIMKIDPDIVIGTGGYISGPVLFMAQLFGKPTLIQEQNSYPGITTRLLAKKADRVHLSFEESKKYFKKQDNIRITGNPVRMSDQKISSQVGKLYFGLLPDRPTLLVFGGSQGAQAINEALIRCIDRLLLNADLQIIWGTGESGYDAVALVAEKHAPRVWFAKYISEMEKAYAAADMAVCRAGAMTLAEITLHGLPAILVPYPYAAANHQETNARALEKSGAAIVLKENELNNLCSLVLSLFNNPEKRRKMSQAALQASHPNAVDDLVSSIFELVEMKSEERKTT